MDHELLNRLKMHLGRRLSGEEVHEGQDWEALRDVVIQLLEQRPAEHQLQLARILREAGPALGEGHLPGNASLLLHELERVAPTRASRPPAPAAEDELARVAALLRGRALLVIGGDPRPDVAERWRAAFGLAEVLWPRTSEVRPDLSALEPYVARPSVVAVVLLLKFVRHAFSEGVPGLCKRHGKPVARAGGEYSPAQLARILLEQCGKRLSG